MRNYKMIRKNLDYLKLLVEKSELWVTKTETSGSSKGKDNVVKDDSRLKKICLQESLDIVIGGGSSGSYSNIKVIELLFNCSIVPSYYLFSIIIIVFSYLYSISL